MLKGMNCTYKYLGRYWFKNQVVLIIYKYEYAGYIN